MLVTNISEFDAGEYIESDEDAIAYFNAMAETGDSTLLKTGKNRRRYVRIVSS